MSNRFLPNHQLSATELSLIPEAFYQLLLARIKVSSLKSEKYLPATEKKVVRPGLLHNSITYSIATVINGLAVRTPWPSTCLVRVIAAHQMLKRRGIPHVLHFGVQKNSSTEIKAHAWLSVGNKIIVGGEYAEGFTEISKISS